VPPAKRAAKKPQAGGNAPHAAAWRLLLPFLMFAVAALAAALHKAVGEPLGAAATAKLAEFWQFNNGHRRRETVAGGVAGDMW